MKKIFLPILAFSFMASTSVNALNNQPKKPKKAKPEQGANSSKEKKKNNPVKKELSPEEEQKIWMEYATPSEVHKMLAQSNGSWSAEITQWLKPDAEPMRSEGKCVNEMIMDGRYQIGKFSGQMMGMPFEGMSLIGFDNATQEFTNVWIDNMGTGVMTMKGKWDEKTKSIDFRGQMVDPVSKGNIPFREVFTIKDENTQTMEMYAPTPDGKGEFKTMEIIFRR